MMLVSFLRKSDPLFAQLVRFFTACCPCQLLPKCFSAAGLSAKLSELPDKHEVVAQFFNGVALVWCGASAYAFPTVSMFK